MHFGERRVKTRHSRTLLLSREPGADLATNGVDNVVNLEDTAHGLGGERDSAGGDEEGLDHVLLQDVGNGALPHIDPSRFLALHDKN